MDALSFQNLMLRLDNIRARVPDCLMSGLVFWHLGRWCPPIDSLKSLRYAHPVASPVLSRHGVRDGIGGGYMICGSDRNRGGRRRI